MQDHKTSIESMETCIEEIAGHYIATFRKESVPYRELKKKISAIMEELNISPFNADIINNALLTQLVVESKRLYYLGLKDGIAFYNSLDKEKLDSYYLREEIKIQKDN